MLFRLSKAEMHLADCLGRDTVKLCNMQGATPRFADTDDGTKRISANIRAYRGEILFARLFNLEKPTLNVLGDEGVDAWLGDISIDVKVSSKEWGDLIFDKGKFKADGAVGFGQCEEPDVLRLHGCIQRVAFLEQHELFDYGYGEKMRMLAKELMPIEQLWLGMVKSSIAIAS
jgi:hypothetical protein